MTDDSDLPVVVVAIDFGTSYSGYAFSFRSEFKKSNESREIFRNSWSSGMAGNLSLKAPTVALFDPNKEFHSFGYEAQKQFSNLTEYKEHKEWYYFSKFKMQLFDKMKLSRNQTITDESGKSLPAMRIFSESIGCLVRKAVSQINRARHKTSQLSEKDITWVLTVPAIWNEPAKQFMREAAVKAGIDKDKLMLALEPEAAALYCRYLPCTSGGKDENDILSFLHYGGRYMVVDIGGGTVDIAVHEVSGNGKNVTEILPASGGDWGGESVNQSFFDYFIGKVGKEISKKIKMNRTSHWMKLEANFEEKKRQLTTTFKREIRLDIPPPIIIEGKLNIDLNSSLKMDISNDIFRSFFNSTNNIIRHMKHILDRVVDIDLILMVGGGAQSDYVSNMVKQKFSSKTVMVPTKAEVAVMEGAVLFGFEPWIVSARMCRYTYGIACIHPFKVGVHREEYRREVDGRDMCDNIFDKLVTEGEVLEIHETRVTEQCRSTHKSESRKNVVMICPFFASNDRSCQYVTEESCKRIGNIEIHPPADGWPDLVTHRLEMYFGRTEFEVKIFNDNDDREYSAEFDFLIERQNVPEVLPSPKAPGHMVVQYAKENR
ncbi:heat shock 70 kDa protein 12A-like [Argopecten irradians]|uniref:heat shock 70 kDa protein 12A-like n=1 Tax=Argopecten irradians TaxID=31199 RepID=UPI00371EAC6B